MTSDIVAADPPQPATRRRPRKRWIVVGVAVLVLAALGWVVVRALLARDHLLAAQRDLEHVRAAISAGDVPSARAQLAAASHETAAARGLTSDPVWSGLASIPYAGRTLRVTAGLAKAADDLTRDTLPPLVQVAGTLDPRDLRTAGNRIDLAPFRAVRPTLDVAAKAAAAERDAVAVLPSSFLLPPVAHARATLLHQLTVFAGSTDTADRAAALLPPMLGADGPRTYFVAFQTNAEARGTGGLIGAFGIVRADDGRVTLEHTGSDVELKSNPPGVVSFGPAYDALYGPADPEWFWVNSNISPHFPYGARIWASLWERQSGQHVDGVVAMDPVAMSDVLTVTGPVTLPDGTKVTAANAVRLTEDTAYRRITDVMARKAFFQTVARAVFGQITAGIGHPRQLTVALGKAAGGRHVQLWSAHPEEERLIEPLPISGVLPETKQPYLQVSVINVAGGKLDYFLRRAVTYTAGSCDGATRQSTVTITLTNTAPRTGLGDYQVIRADHPKHPYPRGQNHDWLLIYTTDGAQLASVTRDGTPTTLSVQSERGHPRMSTYVDLNPGQTTTFRLILREPTSHGAPRVDVQPLATPQATKVTVPTCR